MHEKKKRCSYCQSEQVIRRGIRRGKIKYHCKVCGRWFQINRVEKKPTVPLLFQHLRGVSFRSLGEEYGIGSATAYRRCLEALRNLPHCADVTRNYCSKFCGILLVDGKYIKVKGYQRKIPVIYGIDYLTHDIPTYIFSQAENYHTCRSFFTSLRLLNYPLQGIVSDDNSNIYQAAQSVYPKVHTQLCTNHYKETIRASLSVRTDTTYVPFMKEIESLFIKRRSQQEFSHLATKIVHRYKDDPRCISVMVDIQRRLPQLTAYMHLQHLPTTTNLIESYNSHLEARLKTMKGFESFRYADMWLNGYFLKRRLQPFTDCTKKFKGLNGTCSLQHSMKNPTVLPKLLKLMK